MMQVFDAASGPDSEHLTTYHGVPTSASTAGCGPAWLIGENMTKTPRMETTWVTLERKQIPQVVKNLENGDEPKEALERAMMPPRQVGPTNSMSDSPWV